MSVKGAVQPFNAEKLRQVAALQNPGPMAQAFTFRAFGAVGKNPLRPRPTPAVADWLVVKFLRARTIQVVAARLESDKFAAPAASDTSSRRPVLTS